MVIKPDNVEVSMKVHWVSFEVADGAVRDALASFGTVQEIVLDTWRLDGFVGMQSTTADAESECQGACGLVGFEGLLIVEAINRLFNAVSFYAKFL